MGSLRLSGELTQSYADLAEVQDFSFLLLPPRPLTQAPPPGPLPGVASAHQTSLITGRRWTQALPFRRRKARPASQGRIASQHCFTLDTSLPSSEPPRKTASDTRLQWDIPSPGGRRGRLTHAKSSLSIGSSIALEAPLWRVWLQCPHAASSAVLWRNQGETCAAFPHALPRLLGHPPCRLLPPGSTAVTGSPHCCCFTQNQ